MKIAIIGGGWVGCHLTKNLIDLHQVDLFEKNDLLFLETSSKNQNRLHYGFHYSRNYKTRNLCKITFDRFIDEYGFIVSEIEKNYYCIPKKESLIDFQTYIKIFEDYDLTIVDNNFTEIEGCLNTKEKHIDYKKSKLYFNEILKNNFIKKEIKESDLVSLKKDYDLVINCTNNFLNSSSSDDHFYEITISFLYRKINEIEFDALTLVDGNLFSIYPYSENLFTVTDVEFTPIKKVLDSNSLGDEFKKIKESDHSERRKKIESKIKKYYKNFNQNFVYDSFFISIKSKVVSESDDRSPIIRSEDNLINVFTGKIQGVYFVEDFVKNILNT
jgi:hypothetical protein